MSDSFLVNTSKDHYNRHMQIGFIGLGKMGSRMAVKLLQENHDLVVWNRSPEGISNFQFLISNAKSNSNYKITKTIQELVEGLKTPRIVWIMVTAGRSGSEDATQNVLDEVVQYLEQGDIVIDGGNAFYKDSEQRSEKLKAKSVKFLGIGVSGGIKAFENGYPLMVGGDKSAYDEIKPILDSLAGPNGGHAYLGTGGAGHFAKMVHNGIEYGMMQSIGEGFGVLEKAPYVFDLSQVAKLWQKGAIVSSFLLDRAADALQKDPKLAEVSGEIDATGEAEWTVRQAKEENVPIENIEQSLAFRKRSKTEDAVTLLLPNLLLHSATNSAGTR